MKANIHFVLGVLLLIVTVVCQAQQTASVPPPTPYSIVQRGSDSRVWEQTNYELSPSGQVIPYVQHYTELASGLCYQQNGQWVDSQEQINILPDGSGAATNGQHQAYFPVNIYNGVITLVTPDGLQLNSQPLGLSYDDGTNTVLIAELTNSVGQLISSNQVIYTNAFIGIDADLMYSYRFGGFEQDVIFREQPPTPEEFGMDATNSRLQMLTEFFNPPTPNESVGRINNQAGLQDTTLTFGKMQMAQGKAFLIGDNPQNLVNHIPVYKSWTVVDGRTFLIEELPYQQISAQLASLPMPSATAINSGNSPLHEVSSKRLLPHARLTEITTNTMQLARADLLRTPGVEFDYVTIDMDVTNFTFQGDTTYFISDEYGCWGTTILEGGTVIKFNNSGQLDINDIGTNGAIDCETGPYRPAIFTSYNDNSFGFGISGSSGNPHIYDGDTFLNINATNDIALEDARFDYCDNPINSPAFLEVRDCQFYDVDQPIVGYDMALFNVLVYSWPAGGGVFFFQGSSFIAEQMTVISWMTNIIDVSANPGCVIALTNCLWVCTNTSVFATVLGWTNGGSCTLYTNNVASLFRPATPIFQTVGGGSFYLTNSSPYRGAGTANIDPTLLADIQTKTTWPPIVYDDTNISSLTTLSPIAPRDTNSSPDLGYHYDTLDYVFGGCNLSSNLTITTGTAVGWFETNGSVYISGQPYSIALNNGANLSFNGNATQPDYYAKFKMVQEGENGNWLNSGYVSSMPITGNNTNQEPQLSANFTKFSDDSESDGAFFDGYGYSEGASFTNCEFYIAGFTANEMQYVFCTNCLFFRVSASYNGEGPAQNINYDNCTFYGGGLDMQRSSSCSWQVENCSFDGTAFAWNDTYNGDTNYTHFNYNAYNTNNFSWTNYGNLATPLNGMLETNGPNTLMVTNYNWQTSWFGNFYLSTNSPLITNGSTTANLLGLYHFTTQTNQVPEGTNIVDIGYHYVATDQYGNPLDSNGDSIPDYVEDAAGNGSGNWDSTLFLNVIISQPRNGSTLP